MAAQLGSSIFSPDVQDENRANKDEAHDEYDNRVSTVVDGNSWGQGGYTLIPGVSSVYMRIIPAPLPARAAGEPLPSARRRLRGLSRLTSRLYRIRFSGETVPESWW